MYTSIWLIGLPYMWYPHNLCCSCIAGFLHGIYVYLLDFTEGGIEGYTHEIQQTMKGPLKISLKKLVKVEYSEGMEIPWKVT